MEKMNDGFPAGSSRKTVRAWHESTAARVGEPFFFWLAQRIQEDVANLTSTLTSADVYAARIFDLKDFRPERVAGTGDYEGKTADLALDTYAAIFDLDVADLDEDVPRIITEIVDGVYAVLDGAVEGVRPPVALGFLNGMRTPTVFVADPIVGRMSPDSLIGCKVKLRVRLDVAAGTLT